MIVIVLILVSATVQMVSATGEVTWHLKNETFSTPPTTHASDKIMDQYNPTGSTHNIITLGPDGEGWWYAESAAQCDLSFPLGDWIVTCWIETNSSDDEYIGVYIYNITNTGDPLLIKYGGKNLDSSDGIYKLSKTFEAVPATNIYEGDRIAVRVTFSGTADAGEWLKIYYNSTTYNSTLTSPPNSPAWPVPELPTLIFVSAGLLILAGYAYVGRRSK